MSGAGPLWAGCALSGGPAWAARAVVCAVRAVWTGWAVRVVWTGRAAQARASAGLEHEGRSGCPEVKMSVSTARWVSSAAA